MPTILISAYRNVSIRYLLYSDILKELQQAGLKIVVLLKENDLDYYRNKFSSSNIHFRPIHFNKAHQSIKTPLGRLFTITRKMMSGGRNKTDEMRRAQYRQELGRSWPGLMQFFVMRGLAFLGQRLYFIRHVLLKLEEFFFPGKMYDEIFVEFNPKLLLVSSIGYMVDPLIMRSAKRHGCKVVSIIHSWDNPTTKGYRGGDPDEIIVWNKPMKQEVVLYHDYPAGQIFEGGIAHWDFYFRNNHDEAQCKDFIDSLHLDENRKTIFYGTSSPVMFRQSFAVIEDIMEAIKSGTITPPAQLLVRLHPNYFLLKKNIVDYQAKMTALKIKYGNLICFCNPQFVQLSDDMDLPFEDLYNLGYLFKKADLLLTEYSTLIIEAAIFDIPIINVGLYNYRDSERPISIIENFTHLERILKHKATRDVYNHDDLFKMINRYLAHPEYERMERKAIVDQEITANPGNAGSVIGKHITKYPDQ